MKIVRSHWFCPTIPVTSGTPPLCKNPPTSSFPKEKFFSWLRRLLCFHLPLSPYNRNSQLQPNYNLKLSSNISKMSGFDAQHTAVDVEKGAHGSHHNHSNGSVANGNSHYSSQEGGAPLNLRNITPGGHPLDRVSFSCQNSPTFYHSLTFVVPSAESTRVPYLPQTIRQPCSSRTMWFRVDYLHAVSGD